MKKWIFTIAAICLIVYMCGGNDEAENESEYAWIQGRWTCPLPSGDGKILLTLMDGYSHMEIVTKHNPTAIYDGIYSISGDCIHVKSEFSEDMPLIIDIENHLLHGGGGAVFWKTE